ncbi:RNA-binding domain-containing protein [Annulohypoxylon nitens]|nr:RNA-binding domain-containing protein [Annulohypoxylon nitens]
MDYRSPSRDRYESRSPTPRSRYSRSPSPTRRRHSPTRSPTPVSRRNGRLRSESRSPSQGRDDRGRSESPLRGSTKIVVEKLTKTINEEHLHEIFGQYGPIRDLDMPMNRQFNTNRGTAYILYIHEADAEAAIAHMHEAVLDGTVINVSIVLPRRKFSPSPPTATRGANIDPRHSAPGPRVGGRVGAGSSAGGGRSAGFGGGRQPRSPRYGRSGRENFDTYRPRSYSRSRSPPHRRNRSLSGSYGSRSRSPPRRRGGRKENYNGHEDDRRRSPSYDSFRGRSRSRSRGRGYR